MSRSRLIVLALLPCALLTTGCGNSVFPVSRDPPPTAMLQVPERPLLAPAGATDNELAAERVRMGAAYVKLEQKFRDLVCYVVQCTPPTAPSGRMAAKQ